MDERQFWEIIEATRVDLTARWQAEYLKERNQRYREALSALPPEEVLAFRRLLEGRLIEAYRWDLFAAAVLVRDGCTLTSFRDFRAWLVAQGRAVFEAALRDPESLADNPELQVWDDAGYSAFLSIPWGVYQERAGGPMPDVGPAHPEEPAGERLPDKRTALKSRFPRLYATFFREEWEDEEPEEESQAEVGHPPTLQADVPPMEEERFWTLVEESRRQAAGASLDPGEDFIDRHIEHHKEVLRRLSPEELIAYDRRFDALMDQAYRWDLWGAAYWLHGGCSDDGFIDFRSCLISLGREAFYRVLDNPDALADLADRSDVPYMQSEGFQYVDSEVYQEKTGDGGMPPPPDGSRRHPEPQGEEFDFEDDAEMRRRYPRLVARYPDMGD